MVFPGDKNVQNSRIFAPRENPEISPPRDLGPGGVILGGPGGGSFWGVSYGSYRNPIRWHVDARCSTMNDDDDRNINDE